MHPLKIVETSAGNYSLLMNVGDTSVDEAVQEIGYEPNGYFWAGIAQRIVAGEAPALESRVRYDPEGSMFCAYGPDRAALEDLGARMHLAVTDASRLRALVAAAESDGIELDD